MVSAAFFARGILDWVETCRSIVRLATRLLRGILERSTIAIANPIQRREGRQDVMVKLQGKTLLLTNVIIPQDDRSDRLVPII